MILQKSEVESVVHSPGDYILLSADKYEIKVSQQLSEGKHAFITCAGMKIGSLKGFSFLYHNTLKNKKNMQILLLQVWPLGREINCKCLKTLSVSEDRSISLQPRLQFDGRYIVCSSDLGVYQWDFASFEILRYSSMHEHHF